MTDASPLPKLCILAGGGIAPRSLINACQRDGRPFFVVGLEGQADAATFPNGLPHLWLPLGAASRLKTALMEQGVKELVMIGRVRRPSLAEIKPDALAFKVLAKIGLKALGDDALLRCIGQAIEEESGIRVVGAHEVLGGLLAREGKIGNLEPDDDARKDIARGIEIAQTLGHLDIGQSVIVQQGLVLGVEAIEGTDALMERCAALRREGPGGVLVKLAKPQQDNRYDLPTIGPGTVQTAAAAGLCGIAIEASRSLILDRDSVIEEANAWKLFIIGISIAPKG
ncbi:MAG: UDP-2,3-diacylglucosamine diphosphatase LpxI [Bdellovibrionales bacterium]